MKETGPDHVAKQELQQINSKTGDGEIPTDTLVGGVSSDKLPMAVLNSLSTTTNFKVPIIGQYNL